MTEIKCNFKYLAKLRYVFALSNEPEQVIAVTDDLWQLSSNSLARRWKPPA